MREITDRPTLTLPPMEAANVGRALRSAAMDPQWDVETGIALSVLVVWLHGAVAECERYPEASVVVEVRTVGVER